jgi:Zn-dependent M28 family amino/carboxypeptidase
VGANDGASSTAVLLELARRLAIGPRQYTGWVVFFDGEEERDPESNRGALHGSRYFVEALARSGQIGRVRAAVVVDMIGDRELDIRRDSGSAGWLNEIVWTTAGRLGHGRHFLEETVSIEDDHVPFLRAGVPAALLIDYNYGRTPEGRGFWHTPEDTIDKLSPRSLGVVGDVLVNALPAIETSLGRR